MDTVLMTASLLIVFIAVAHSWLGEKYIIIRLLRRTDLPKLFGTDQFTRQTIRFAWHLTTIAWAGLAGVLLALSGISVSLKVSALILYSIGITFLISAVLALFLTHGRHLSWIIFIIVSILIFIRAV
jgi:hypothetical protein